MRRILIALACLVLAPIAAAAPERNAWRDARQLVLVVTPAWDAAEGELRAYERDGDGAWQPVGDATHVTVGRSGAAWGLGLHRTHAGPVKQEGDGRSPAGVFRLGDAFGYAPARETALHYLPMSASHYCIDVPASPRYNTIVDARDAGEAAVAGSTEPMRLDLHGNGDVRYRAGFVILHNAQQRPGAGSCIFAHLWRTQGEATSGCTAMDEAAMDRLYAWLDPLHMPVFVLLPRAEYAKLRRDWHLP